jgi:hypothetical protein
VGRLSRRISGDNPVVVHYEITGRPGTAFLHALQTLLDLSTTAQLTMPDSPRITVLDVDDPEREWSNRLDTLGPDDGRPSAHWCQGATSSRSLMAESLKRALEDRAFSDPQQTPSCFKCKSFRTHSQNRTITGRVPNSCPKPRATAVTHGYSGSAFFFACKETA